MPSGIAIKGILRVDGLRVLRDRFILGTAVYILVLSTAMRWLIPWAGAELMRRLSFDLGPYVTLLVSHLVIQLAPLLFGIVGGFLLLESRESRTVRALLVSPVPLAVQLRVLCGWLLLGAVLLSVFEAVVIGIALPPWGALFAAALAGAPGALIVSLAIASAASNKTEAFAYLKFASLAPVAASAAYFLPEPWQWLTAIYPPFCASKAYWIAQSGGASWPLWAIGGLVLSALWVATLARTFERAARR